MSKDPKIDGDVKHIGVYYVTADGRVFMKDHSYKNRWGGISKRKGKELSLSPDQDGYLLVTMKNLGWSKHGLVKVHQLVAFLWHGKKPDGYQVNHIDGNKSNNHYTNLEYLTCKQNIRHAVNIGLMKSGKYHHKTKTLILKKNNTQLKLSGLREIESAGLCAKAVHRVARGERKTYKGWSVEYA